MIPGSCHSTLCFISTLLLTDGFYEQGSIHAALDQLLGIEKQQRLAEDVTGTKMACAAILDLLFKAKEWKLLNEHILLLNKRRSQLKQVHKSGVSTFLQFLSFLLGVTIM